MIIDKEDYKLLQEALQSYKEMMSDDEDDEQENSEVIAVCQKYLDELKSNNKDFFKQVQIIVNLPPYECKRN